MQASIDTLKVARSFESAGFRKEQAEVLATAFGDAAALTREDLVTKDYLKAEMAELKTDLLRWLLASQAVLVVILVAVANFTRTFG